MDQLQRMMKKAKKITDYYDYLQQRSFYMLIDAFSKTKESLYQSDQKSIIQWRLKALAQMGGLTKDVVDFISKNIGYSKKAIYDLIQDEGLKVAKHMSKDLSETLNQPTKGISTDTMQIINSYADQTFRDVDNYVNQTLLTTNTNRNPVLKTYQEIVNKTVLDVSTGIKTPQVALKDNILQWYDKGLPTTLVDKGGHNWSLEGYTRTVINSTTHRVFNEARMSTMKEFDSVLATMSSHPAARPACAPIQGKVVCIVSKSDPRADLSYPNIYDYGFGKPAGTQGINCAHILYPYIKGVSHNYQKQYDPKEAVRNAAIQQKQRYYERQIRHYKHKRELAERINDPSQVKKINQNIRGYQAKLRTIVKDNKFLTRQYNRERIIPTPQKVLNERGAKIRLTQKQDKQAVHILNTPEYKRELEKRPYAPSYFTISPKEIDNIVQAKASKDMSFKAFQFVNADKTIGIYKDRTGKSEATNRMKLMQSKNGYHAVPAPKEDKRNEGNK